MKNLLELRDEIDVIDKQIVALYQQRMQIAAEVAEYKIETGKKVFDKDREMEKLATLSALGDSAFNRHGIRELFEQKIFDCCILLKSRNYIIYNAECLETGTVVRKRGV